MEPEPEPPVIPEALLSAIKKHKGEKNLEALEGSLSGCKNILFEHFEEHHSVFHLCFIYTNSDGRECGRQCSKCTPEGNKVNDDCCYVVFEDPRQH